MIETDPVMTNPDYHTNTHGEPLYGTRRKPYCNLVGYKAMRKCKKAHGYIILLDNINGQTEIDTGLNRWIVQHEPSSLHVTLPTYASAYDLMKQQAEIYDGSEQFPTYT